jgi:acyl-CoA reductase-like NAD-dependent aldehyde dehydrogenase/nicotinamidase-related amidase
MKPVLLLVDLQRDFLDREISVPPAEVIIRNAASLLGAFREQGLPVLHVQTLVRADGSDRMPHWQKAGTWACVEGTPGCAAPSELEPRAGEPVFPKRFFSGFENPDLATRLRELSAAPLVVAGVYLHGCVRATVLDAYARGHEVWVASDAVGSPDPVHAAITREYLEGRAASFLDQHQILARLSKQALQASRPAAGVHPVACIGERWLAATEQDLWELRNPSHWDEVLEYVPIAGATEVAAATARASEARASCAGFAHEARIAWIERWAEILCAKEKKFAQRMAIEVGKPVADGAAEVSRTARMLRTISGLFDREEPWAACGRNGDGVWARRRPLGVVALVTPWNNPVALPAAKIAAALVFGNTVVWKPAIQAPHTSVLLLESLFEAGCPPGAVNLIFGDALTAQRMIASRAVAAVSLTGSSGTGRRAARSCAELLKPLQAELGGNNAAVVCSDCDIDAVARELSLAAFSFAGQRCTATRRIIVAAAVFERFRDAFVSEVRALRVGDPLDPATQVGPLISREKRDQIQAIVAEAERDGARILCGGDVPETGAAGCWFEPTVLAGADPRSPVVQEESFGPLAVMLSALDFDAALELCNDVEQGLVASLYTRDRNLQSRFLAAVETGALKLNRPTLEVHPEAPFGGWKNSGLGPPEHGIWDREFYTRPQAIYGWDEPAASGNSS